MNATTDNRSAADLEREGEEIRADLDRTLDEIERKLSPGELLDQSMEFLRNNGAEFLREAGETVRRNPVPVLLTAAGLIWLTSSVVRSRSRSSRSQDDEAQDFSALRDSDQDYSSSEYSSGDYSRRGHNGGSRRGHNGGGARGIAQATRGRARTAAEKVKGRLSDSMQSVQDRTQDVGSQIVRLVQEQPIALGALALAAGALLGAALPMTPYENRLVGPVHDRTMARAKEVGQREYENIRDAVTSSVGRSGRADESRDTGGASGGLDQPEQG